MSEATFKDYYKLTKPGIIYGNLLTTIAAFIFASRWHFNGLSSLWLFLATVTGIALVIGSACVFNNYLDRTIDAKMARTKDRALVTGIIKPRDALMYGSALGLVGIALLYLYVNTITALLALFGFLFYVGIYGLAKRGSSWGAVIGSVPGAIPIVVGYTAVTGHLDLASLILFAVLLVWQMPHFYAIAMYRLEEYKAAGIPVLPLVKGMRAAKIHILSYIIAFIALTSLLFAVGYAGYVYFILIAIVGLAWFVQGVRGFRVSDDATWARKTFLFSLVVLVAFCVAISLAPLLP